MMRLGVGTHTCPCRSALLRATLVSLHFPCLSAPSLFFSPPLFFSQPRPQRHHGMPDQKSGDYGLWARRNLVVHAQRILRSRLDTGKIDLVSR